MSAGRPAEDQKGARQDMGQDAETAFISKAGSGDDTCALGPDGLAPEIAIEAAEIAHECGGEVNLAGRSESETRTILAAQTARFCAGFLRWMETRAGDGMNFAQLRLLQALHCGGPAIMRDLGTQLGATPRNMTAIVDALEDARLVVRRPHPTDRRATLIELSPDGAREAQEGLGPRLSALSEIFAGLSAAEQEQFSATMRKLTRAIRDRQPGC
jgi:DNA-binding MarR family transcriptional regulator